MDKLWRIISFLLCVLAIWHFASGNFTVGNQVVIMAFIAQILAKMEE